MPWRMALFGSFVRLLARCSSYLVFLSLRPLVPSFARLSHSIFPCSYLPVGIVRIPVRGIREYGRERERERAPIVKVVVARRAVRSFHVLPRARVLVTLFLSVTSPPPSFFFFFFFEVDLPASLALFAPARKNLSLSFTFLSPYYLRSCCGATRCARYFLLSLWP